MYCTSCGAEIKDGAKFCRACGAKVDDGDVVQAVGGDKADGGGAQDAGLTGQAVPGSQPNATFAAQMEADKKRSRRKLSPFMIVALVLALVAGTALAAVLIVQQANQGEAGVEQGPPAQQEQGQPSQQEQEAEPPAASEPELTPDEAAIEALDGWWDSQWHKPPYLPAFGHVHDGVIDWYRADVDGGAGGASIGYGSTVNIARAERFDENGTQGWRFFTDTSPDGSWAYYQADGQQGELPIYMVADGYGVITESSTDHPTRFGMRRITDDYSWEGSLGTRELLEQAKQLAGARDDAAQSDAEPAADPEPFDQAKAEAEARAAAVAAGKQVFAGTIMATTDNDAWVMSTGSNPNAGSYYTNRAVTILLLDQKTAIEGADPTSSSGYKTLQGQDVIELPDSFADAYNGQRVEMAFSRDDLQMPSDVSHIWGTGEVIFVGSAMSTTSVSGGDYLLADSSSRAYSRGELEAMDLHTLFLARNEIYARHGRQFQSAELQQYFGSKPWYSGTVAPSAFSESVLSQIERDNANLMLAIEKERNSPYLG